MEGTVELKILFLCEIMSVYKLVIVGDNENESIKFQKQNLIFPVFVTS